MPVIGLLVVFLAFAAVVLAIAVVIGAAFMLAPAAAVYLAAYYGRREQLLQEVMGRAGVAPGIVRVGLAGTEPEVDIDESALAAEIAKRAIWATAFALGLGALVLIGLGVLTSNAAVHDPVERAVQVLSAVVAVGAGIALGLAHSDGGGLADGCLATLRRRCAGALRVDPAAITALRAAGDEAAVLAARFGVADWHDYLRSGMADLLAHELRSRPLRDLNIGDAVARATRRFADDLPRLRQAAGAFDAAEDAWRRAARVVRRKGSPALHHELETRYSWLHSEALGSLVRGREWDTLDAVLREAVEDFAGLARQAAAPGAAEASGSAASGDVRDEAWALAMLNLPASATPEQIKEIRRVLAKLWHADAGGTGNHARMADINAAYDLLKQARGFR